MTSSIKSLVTSTLNAAGAYGKGIDALRTALTTKGTMSPVDVRAELLAPVAAFYGVAVLAKVRGEGYTLDKDAAGFEAAKKAIQRMTTDIVGKVAKETAELEVPAEMLALARKLVKLGVAYEQSGKLIAAAIALAKAE